MKFQKTKNPSPQMDDDNLNDYQFGGEASDLELSESIPLDSFLEVDSLPDEMVEPEMDTDILGFEEDMVMKEEMKEEKKEEKKEEVKDMNEKVTSPEKEEVSNLKPKKTLAETLKSINQTNNVAKQEIEESLLQAARNENLTSVKILVGSEKNFIKKHLEEQGLKVVDKESYLIISWND